MPGPKPTPTHLRILRGNPGKRALPKDEPVASSDAPVAPEWLSARAKEVFAQLALRLDKMGYASSSHTEALALAAMRQEEVERCSKALEKGFKNRVKTTSGGYVFKAKPEVAMRSEAARHLQSLLAEFGLSPASATKVVVSSKQKKNAFAAF
ncbi:MAG: phage terminase small subunit P27 family [Deltaproteobacteria bacterium]|nr:phage terminase small subunit P27 family [Deltaproteobacteria bacterium]